MESKPSILQVNKILEIILDYAAHCLREAQKSIPVIEVLPTPSIKVGPEMVVRTLSDSKVNKIEACAIHITGNGSSGSNIWETKTGKFIRNPKTKDKDKEQLFQDSMYGVSAAALMELQAATPSGETPGFVKVIGVGQINETEIQPCADAAQLKTSEAGILVEKEDMSNQANIDSRQKLYGLVTYLQGQKLLKDKAGLMATDIKGSIKWGGVDASGKLQSSKVLDIDFVEPITPGSKARHYALQLNWVNIGVQFMKYAAQNAHTEEYKAFRDNPFAEMLYALAIGIDYEFLPETEKVRFKELVGFSPSSLENMCDLLIDAKVEDFTQGKDFKISREQFLEADRAMLMIRENPLPLNCINGETVLNFKSKFLSDFGVRNEFGFLLDYQDAFNGKLTSSFALDMNDAEKKWLEDNIPDAVAIVHAEYSDRDEHAGTQELYK
ncbi:hypothetical protein HZB78_04030 [Candidatus Collierbacteria bacterium]|nr:hypothetical protein [Candidatus Collierbacteria bacterium]